MSSHAILGGTTAMHSLVRWFHPTSVERLAEQVVDADVGKRSLQLDTLTFYDLASASPKVWQQSGAGPGGSGDLSYVHTQGVASATWVITHNLGKRPAITVIDSSGDECEGSIHHDSVNQATVTFSAPFSGTAICN